MGWRLSRTASSFWPRRSAREQARENDEYQGVRVTLEARIAGARLSLQVDIGFGDVVVPRVQEIEYPGLLDLPTPRLRAYPPETVIAEKFQAMVCFGAVTSRMKDFYDLWAIATMFGFEGPVLAEAIQATFERRRTSLPEGTPTRSRPSSRRAGLIRRDGKLSWDVRRLR